LSRDKKTGGHILDCISANINIEIETLNNFELKFPTNDEFYKAEFGKNPTQGS
jgi:acetolactate decarboxylase